MSAIVIIAIVVAVLIVLALVAVYLRAPLFGAVPALGLGRNVSGARAAVTASLERGFDAAHPVRRGLGRVLRVR